VSEKRPRPWETEEAAFGCLLRVLAVCVVIVLLVLLLKTVF
jgi:hypothetical protein